MDPVTQLGRYLIEIVAFTFNSDYALLNQALGQPTFANFVPTKNSILTEDERVELLRLALISKELYGKHRGHQFLTTRDSDRRALADGIIKPAIVLDLAASYILELISTYANHQCDVAKRNHTLISLNAPQPLWLFRKLTFFLWFFGEHFDAHSRIISAISPNEGVRIMLGDAMRRFQENDLGIKRFSNSYSGDDWPDEFREWHDLWRALISDEEWSDSLGEKRRRRSAAVENRVQ